MTPSSVPMHRLSRRALQRQAALRRAWAVAVSIIVLWAFGAGYAWRNWRAAQVAPEQNAPQATAEQRAEARALLDRAVTARFDGLTNEAARLASDASRTSPHLPGVAIFASLMALDQGDVRTIDVAAREALDENQYSGDARLVLALNAWMQRGQAGSDSAGARSTQLLAEASESDLANHQVRFFAGDLLRAIGRPGEAHMNLLGSLYRQAPWDSAALLVAKTWLALEETGSADRSGAALATGPEGDIYGAAAVRLQRAPGGADDAVSAMSDLRSIFTGKQFALLLGDPALGVGKPATTKVESGSVLPPFADTAFPDRREEEMTADPAGQQGGADSLFQLPESVLLGQ